MGGRTDQFLAFLLQTLRSRSAAGERACDWSEPVVCCLEEIVVSWLEEGQEGTRGERQGAPKEAADLGLGAWELSGWRLRDRGPGWPAGGGPGAGGAGWRSGRPAAGTSSDFRADGKAARLRERAEGGLSTRLCRGPGALSSPALRLGSPEGSGGPGPLGARALGTAAGCVGGGAPQGTCRENVSLAHPRIYQRPQAGQHGPDSSKGPGDPGGTEVTSSNTAERVGSSRSVLMRQQHVSVRRAVTTRQAPPLTFQVQHLPYR